MCPLHYHSKITYHFCTPFFKKVSELRVKYFICLRYLYRSKFRYFTSAFMFLTAMLRLFLYQLKIAGLTRETPMALNLRLL